MVPQKDHFPESVKRIMLENAVAPIDEKAILIAQARETVPGLRMDEMMAKHVDDDKRRRPMMAEALKKAEGALRGWRWGRKDKDDTPVISPSSGGMGSSESAGMRSPRSS